MKREINPVYAALFLVFGCVLFRLVFAQHPDALPGITPFTAAAFVAGLCLPRRWGWLVGPVAFLLSDFAFLGLNQQTTGSMFSWWSLIAVAVYAVASLLGIVLARRASLLPVIGGSLACSLLFYVAANTFAWWENLALGLVPAYPGGFAGWVQANWAGLPGYVPSWVFLRNGVLGDLVFTLLFLLILDRGLVLSRASLRSAAARAA